MSPTLHIYLLGDFRLVYGDEPITGVDSARLQSLFAYLVLHHDAPQSRHHLAFLFWPDSSEAQAHTNLRKLVYQLRRALPDADRFLQLDAQMVQWRADAPFTLDMDDFNHTLAQATSTTALQRAVDIYRGDLLLSCYDDWIVPERERLRQMLIEALERLVLLLEEERDYATVIQYAHRLLGHDPVHEATYRTLMRLYAASGDRAGVERTYRRCTTVLRRELAVEPSPATREAYARLRKATPPVAESARRHNLPAQFTSFVGRQAEIAMVQDLLLRPDVRLVTLTGPGGVGKTRLALQAAGQLLDHFADGVTFVPLASVRIPGLVVPAIAQAVGVRETGSQPLFESLKATLRDRRLLLVLDNFEHVRAATPYVTGLLSACPALTILITSRSRLHLSGEHEFRVPVLPQAEALALFQQRAQAAQPTFRLTDENMAAVAEICARLEGLPLALELAAARVRLLSPQALLAQLAGFMRTPGGVAYDLPTRQRTLWQAIDWSYNLLDEAEQRLFRRLAVFVGGFTLEAAAAVVSGPWSIAGESVSLPAEFGVLNRLASLADKNLVHQGMSMEGEPRLAMLETIREYALEELAASGEAAAIRQRHALFFLALAEEAAPRLKGAEQLTWLNRLESEHDNLRAAMEWLLESGAVSTAMRLAAALSRFWHIHGHYSEAQEHLQRVLAQSDAVEDDTAARATVLNALGFIYVTQGNDRAARPWLEEALALSSAISDQPNIAWSLHLLACVSLHQRDYAAARSFAERALERWRELGDNWSCANSLNYVGEAALLQGDDEEAQTRYEEAATLLRQLQNRDLLAFSLRRLGQLALRRRDYSRAIALCQESLKLNVELGDKQAVAACLSGLAGVATARGQTQGSEWRERALRYAARLFGAADALLQAVGASLGHTDRAEYERNVATVRAQLGDEAFAAAWAQGQALTLEQAVAEALRDIP